MTVQQKNTFSTLAKEWFLIKESQWKPSTTAKYMNILKIHLIPYFAEKTFDEITRNDIVTFSNQLLAHGEAHPKALSPKTASDILSLLKSILEYAFQTGACTAFNLNGIYIRQPYKPLKTFSPTEQQRISFYIWRNPEPCHLGILLSLYTGLRLGEICALKWQDICLEEQYIYVHATMQRLQVKDNPSERKTEIVFSAPKSSCSIRRIPLPCDISCLLKKHRRSKESFLITGTAQYMEPRTMQNRFKLLLKNCNIEDTNFHTLRHTFATRCIELNFDVKSLSEILGHANVNITMNRYVHPSMEMKKRNMDKLSFHFFAE